ncbi:MAG TPA: YdcF family protein [Aliidongia sp.]|nr:YdcF family protein [Aliidongia sp.]
MFFTAAKIFTFLASPSHFGLILLVAATVLLFTRHHRAARWLLLPVAIGGLGLPGAVQWLAQPLENHFPARPPLCRIDGIIMLGGGEDPKLSHRRGEPLLRDRAGKYFEALDLLRRFPDAKLIVAAGSGSWDPEGTHETDVASALFDQAGIPAARVILESESRDTFENFRNAKAIVAPAPDSRWVLLTGAIHMPRSVAIAHEVGFPVIPWPTDYMTKPEGLMLTNDFGESLKLFDGVFHEWVGLVVYRLSGRTATLLPAPTPVDGGCATATGPA